MAELVMWCPRCGNRTAAQVDGIICRNCGASIKMKER